MQDPSKCLRELQYKSLLNYDTHTQRYRFHQLIKEFFTYISNKYEDNNILKETFLHHFGDYYKKFGFTEAYKSLRQEFHLLDKERSNIDFLLA